MVYPIFKALDKSFIKKLFEKKIKLYFGAFREEKIKKIEIKRISPTWAKETCLVRYKIFFNSERTKVIRGTAKKEKSKENIFEIMKYLYQHGFSKGNFLAPRAIDLIREINLLLYEEVDGQPFSLIIKKGDFSETEGNLKRIAKWLVKLHKLKPKNYSFKNAFFLGKDNYEKLLKEIPKLMPSLKNDLKDLPKLDFIEKIWKIKKVLIHNDLYPGNLIVNKAVIFGIDFDKSGFGPPLMDVAALYGSLEFPKEVWKINSSKGKTLKLQEIFLKTYCSQRKMNYQKTKELLQLFLIKIFLDQIHYYFYFTKEGWRYFDANTKKSFTEKIKALVSKIKEKVNIYESSIYCF